MSPAVRLAAAALGMVAVLAGIGLLTHGTAGNAERLARIAGILILAGVVAVVAAIVGKL